MRGERGERVDRRGALGAHVIARCQQYLHGGTDAVVSSRLAQLCLAQRQCRSGDASGVQRVGLADAAVGAGVHPWSLNDGVAGIRCGAGQAGAVGAGTLDHPERVCIAASTARGP